MASMSTLDHYAKAADQHERWLSHQPIVLGGPGSRLTSLAFCQRFNRDAHYGDIVDSRGVAHWATQKQIRISGIVARMVLGDGKARMLDIAAEAACHTTTVSRTLLKLQAWGLYAIDVRRGRNGGITIMKPSGSWAAVYIRAARQRLRELALRARRNVASTLPGGQRTIIQRQREMDATFHPEYVYHEAKRALKEGLKALHEAIDVEAARISLGRFGVSVLEERRRLAIEDPIGEADSVRPVWG